METHTGDETILIVDDDDDVASAVASVLEQAGYRTCRAVNGEEGVRMADKEAPDLILLDFMMPVKTGFEVCRDLQESEGLRCIPIIALTGFGQNIGEIYGLSHDDAPSSIRDYLEKPVEPNVLLERVGQALSRNG
ncbi:MAG: response regulator [Planctomycetes bacterium]|nr:response regulator [Planctomycetota bacterium]